MSRQNLPAQMRRPFYLYVDEFQNYATFSFAEIMSEARKYGLSLVLAHQSLAQLDEKLASIVLGNAKNFVVFRLDRQDAELIAKYLAGYDPFMVKMSSLESADYYSASEQWELLTAELTELPERVAVLKTKGCDPTMFGTLDLPDSNDYESIREVVRHQNLRGGYLRALQELDADIAVSASAWVRPDEPVTFLE